MQLLNRDDFARFPAEGRAEAVRIALERVVSNAHNPRQHLLEIDALANNIETFGLLQPVTVRLLGDGTYELLAGHRRYAAFKLLHARNPTVPGWRTIPAVVRAVDDDHRDYLRLLSGQIHAQRWSPREEAAALDQLALAGLRLEQIAAALHRTPSWVSKRLRTYSDAVLSDYVQTRRLPVTVAEELLPISDRTTRRALAERAVAEAWGQTRARAEVRKAKQDDSSSTRAAPELATDELAHEVCRWVRVLSGVDSSEVTQQLVAELQALRPLIDSIEAMLISRRHCQIEPLDTSR